MTEDDKFWSGKSSKHEGNGRVSFWLNDHLHNTEGPAIIHEDGDVTYALQGDRMDKEEWEYERIRFLISSEEMLCQEKK